MAALQTKMEHLEFTGESAAGAVKITMTGKGVATSVKINPSVVDKDDVETLEDLLLVAINDSKGRSEEFLNTEMEIFTNQVTVHRLQHIKTMPYSRGANVLPTSATGNCLWGWY
jgi:DNA-binding YbaB/EbfC family protein